MAKNGIACARDLNRRKARVPLRLALTKTKNLEQIQRYFDGYERRRG